MKRDFEILVLLLWLFMTDEGENLLYFRIPF